MINISERIRDLPQAERRAVFARLKAQHPDIAAMLERIYQHCGRIELELDEATAASVLQRREGAA